MTRLCFLIPAVVLNTCLSETQKIKAHEWFLSPGQTVALLQCCFSPTGELYLNSQHSQAFRRPAGAPRTWLTDWSITVLHVWNDWNEKTDWQPMVKNRPSTVKWWRLRPEAAGFPCGFFSLVCGAFVESSHAPFQRVRFIWICRFVSRLTKAS